ncbi:MAG: hypothetical protein LBG88_01895 [Christensenellaceae bacterium]|nr:hypothetical protein [Christensenellaceae bacterium]
MKKLRSLSEKYRFPSEMYFGRTYSTPSVKKVSKFVNMTKDEYEEISCK